MSDLSGFDLHTTQDVDTFSLMNTITSLEPIFVQAPPRIQVESTSEEFDLSEDVWAAFDHLCEIYNIYDTPRKKFSISA
jgi:hypothetical protein